MKKYTDKQIRKMVFEQLQAETGNGMSEENKILADTCFYSIIENYVSDCPGWCGDILTVVFGYHSCLHTYKIESGSLHEFVSEVIN